MAKAKKLSETEEVGLYYEKLEHPLKNVVEALRTTVLAASEQLAEQIKWNSPSFYYTGEMKPFDPKEYKRDLVVFNLHKKEYVLLVFPTGAKVNDPTGLLEGQYTDGRRTVKISTLEEAEKKASDLQAVILEWLKLIEK